MERVKRVATMALPEYSDLASLSEFKALPAAEKQKMTADYWADYEKENPDQKDFVAQQRDVSTKYVDIRDKYRDATPIEKKLLQSQYDDTEFTLLAAEGMKTGKLSAEEFNTELASRKAQRATDQESFNKTVALFDPKVNEQMQPAYNSMTRLATEGDVFGNLGVTGKANDAVSNFLPGGQDQPISTAKKEYEGLKTRMADNFGIKPEEVDDMIKHRMDLQEAPVSRDATGQVHIKSDLLDQGPEAVTKAIAESQLPDAVKATYTPEKVKERLDTFKQAVVERVKKNSPDLYKWMDLGANYEQPLDENTPDPSSLVDQDYAKVRKHLNDSKTKQLSEGLLGGLEGLAEKGERATGALHEGFSLTTWLPEGTLGPKYVSPLTERAAYVAGRVKMRSDLTNLSHDILKDKVEIFGTDAATIGQGIYSGIESAGLMSATAGLGELVMPASKLAGLAGKTKWLAEGVKAAADIAPMATIYGVDDGSQVYEQAKKAGKSESESLLLGAKSAAAETGITMLASMSHLSGTEGTLAALASREVREKVKRTMLQSAAKFGGNVALGVTGEELEEGLIAFTKELTVQSKLNPQWTSNDMDKAIRDTAVATLFASGPLSALHATQEAISNTYDQTTDELKSRADALAVEAATQENLPETQDAGGPVEAPSDAGVAPAVQMSRSELEAAVIERRAELTDSEEDQVERAELERPLEEVAAERGVELTEENEQNQEIPEETPLPLPLPLPPLPTDAEVPANLEPVSGDQEAVAPAEAEVQGEVATVIPEDNGVPQARAVVSNFLTPEAKALPPEDFQQQKTASPEQVTLQNSVAKMYDELPEDDSSNPEVVQAYENLATEVLEQHKAMLDSGLKIELVSESPYKSSKEMVEDVKQGRLKIQRTDPQTYGESPDVFNAGKHPMLRDSGLRDANGQTLLVNDIFRGVHDYIAHAAFGSTFGPLGEEAAWKAHLSTIKDPLARRALTTETRGQNSWVNYRDEMLRDGVPIKKGELGYVAPQDRPFANQKFALLPEEALREAPRQKEQPTENTQPQVPAAKATPETIVEEKKSLLSSRLFSAVAINQLTSELKNVSVSITSTVTETGAKATYTQPASEVIKEFKKEKSGYEALLACLDS